jgi:hypothetical protein
MTTPDELQRAVERLKKAVVFAEGASLVDHEDIDLLLSERAELLATVERVRGALESAAETLDHVDDALMDMAEAGAVPAVGTWRFVTQAAKRARAALTTGEEK